MNNGYKFGKIEVSCEGYDHPDDPYILKGSCGVSLFGFITNKMNNNKTLLIIYTILLSFWVGVVGAVDKISAF